MHFNNNNQTIYQTVFIYFGFQNLLKARYSPSRDVHLSYLSVFLLYYEGESITFWKNGNISFIYIDIFINKTIICVL